jgi:hypothetical protein
VALLMLWLALLVSNASLGGLIHVLLLAALGLVLWNSQRDETSA